METPKKIKAVKGVVKIVNKSVKDETRVEDALSIIEASLKILFPNLQITKKWD